MNRIKMLREEKKWTQSELGLLLNVKDSAVSKYETGRIPLTAETLKALSEIFGVSVDYIMGISPVREPAGLEEDQIHTIAAHALEELTEDEQQKVLEYAKFIKSTRKKDEE